MCGRQINTVDDALALPTGKLLYWYDPVRHYGKGGFFPPLGIEPGWREMNFSDAAVQWAAGLAVKNGVTRRFSTQAQLLKHAIEKHPVRAFFRGFFGVFRSEKPQRSCGSCSGCPLKRG